MAQQFNNHRRYNQNRGSQEHGGYDPTEAERMRLKGEMREVWQALLRIDAQMGRLGSIEQQTCVVSSIASSFGSF